MDYVTFIERNKNRDLIGEIVWVCDYRHNDIANKPIRHIKPTEVIIVSNDDLPDNKTVYYSDIHFRPIGKKGQPLKRIIAPYDNTGFRSYPGVSLNIFLTKEECVKHYFKQCQEILGEIEEEIVRVNERLDGIKMEINEFMEEFKVD